MLKNWLPEGDPLPGGLQDTLVYRELLHEPPVGLHDAPRPFHVAHSITLHHHQGSYVLSESQILYYWASNNWNIYFFCVSSGSDPILLSFKKYWKVVRIFVCSSVADPDPNVFGPPGSGSNIQRYGSGSGSFYNQTKIVRKTLIPTALWLLSDFFFIFENDVNVPSKSLRKKNPDPDL